MAKTVTKLRIAARRDGWRRAGMRHGADPVFHDLDEFDAEQLQALRNDPNLMVDEVECEAETGLPVGAAPAVKIEADPRVRGIAGALGVDPKAGVTEFVDAIADQARAAENLGNQVKALTMQLAAIGAVLGVNEGADTEAFLAEIERLRVAAPDAKDDAGGKGKPAAKGGKKGS